MSRMLPQGEEARARADERLRLGAELEELRSRIQAARDAAMTVLSLSRNLEAQQLAVAFLDALEGRR
jgi:hypothetical protein